MRPPVLVLASLLVVCSCAGGEPAETTTTPEQQTTIEPATIPTTTSTTLGVPTSATTVPASTTTTARSTGATFDTTSTMADTTLIVLRADGLGLVTLGDPIEEASSRLVEVLGVPIEDAQSLEWTTPQLSVVFNRLDPTTGDWTDTLQLTDWVYRGSGGDPAWVLETPEGISIGSTFSDLQSTFGDDLWWCTYQSEDGETSWQWGTTIGIPNSWTRWWQPEHGFGLSGWFDRDLMDPDARVAGLTAGWRMPDHGCSLTEAGNS